ncbi:hypothetical protein PybrP1_000517 [[Pythium] brassicae (nom. inval.)]|nr:hypothetical protein PybrP1_000517 [[Pythium] brassicae (nom. inval.)]
MAARPSFPLPRGYFGPDTHLTAEQETHFRRVAQTQINAILRAERDFVQTQRGQVNTRKWRLARKEHKLSVFCRRTSSLRLADAHSFPGLLSVGQVDESMEALLHGLRTTTQDEFQATMAYMDANVRDAARLQPACSICAKAGGMFATLKMCNVCGATACAKCRVKRLVFTGVDSSLCEILCCKTCVLEAKALAAVPIGDAFLLADNEQHRLSRDTIWRGTSERSPHPGMTDDNARPFIHDSGHHSTPDHDASSLRVAVHDSTFDEIISDLMDRRAFSKSQRSGTATPAKRFEASPPAPFSQSVSWDKLEVVSSPNSPGYRESLSARSTLATPTAQDELYARMLALQSAAHHAYAITKANEEWMRKL